MESRSRSLPYSCLVVAFLIAVSCVSFPKIAELPPVQTYGAEKTDWDISANCVVIRNETAEINAMLMAYTDQVQAAANPQVAMMLKQAAERNAEAFDTAEICMAQFLQDRGYGVVPKANGYLTREQRKAVDKVIRIDSVSCNYVYGSDGTCTDANITVTTYAIDEEKILTPSSAVSRVLGEKKEAAKHKQATEQAIHNLFTLDEFRQALNR